MALSIECLKLGIYDTNCYLIAPPADGAPVLVIDPAADGEAILSALHGRRVAAVLLTHGHFDHTGALSAFQGVPVYMHADDAPCLTDPHLSAGDTVGDLTPRTGDLHFVQEGDTLHFDGFDLPVRVMHTPGHTRGSVVYCLGNDWFTGVLYIENPNLVPLQTLLQKIQSSIEFIKQNAAVAGTPDGIELMRNLPQQNLRMACMIIIILPVLAAYPFFQRYVVSGLTIGSVKE